MITLIIILVVSLLISTYLVLRGKNRGRLFLTAVGWTGALLILGSIYFLPWIRTGNIGTVEKNAGWIARQGEIIESIKKVPGFENWLADIQVPTGDDIVDALEHPVKERFLYYVDNGVNINAWHFMRMVRKVQPVIFLYIGSAVLCAGVGVILNLRRMILSVLDGQILFRIITISSAITLMLIMSEITRFDTLGATGELEVRLLTTLAETRLGPGAGFCLLGLAMLAASGVADFLPTPARENETEMDFDSYYQV